jgi:hypothetical protein
MEPLLGDFRGARRSSIFQVTGEQVRSGWTLTQSGRAQQLTRLERQGQREVKMQGCILSEEDEKKRSSNRGGGCSEMALWSAPGDRVTTEKTAVSESLSGEMPSHSATISSAPKPRLTCRNTRWGFRYHYYNDRFQHAHPASSPVRFCLAALNSFGQGYRIDVAATGASTLFSTSSSIE